MDKKARDNRANQLNPNNPLYHKSRGHNSGGGSRKPSGGHSGGYQKAKRGYAIYITTRFGSGGYFTKFSTEVYRHGFLHLKKEYYTSIERTPNVAGAKIYPTRDAAEFVASKIGKKEPGYHISVVSV